MLLIIYSKPLDFWKVFYKRFIPKWYEAFFSEESEDKSINPQTMFLICSFFLSFQRSDVTIHNIFNFFSKDFMNFQFCRSSSSMGIKIVMTHFIWCLVFGNFGLIMAQDVENDLISSTDTLNATVNSVDSIATHSLLIRNEKYFEDQFYIGLSYNLLLNKPDAVNQRNLSYGLQGGVIKDIPLNANRTIALGMGMGYGLYSYFSNLRAIQNMDEINYEVLIKVDSIRNKLETHMLEFPLEFRLRNSTPSRHKFWRLYAGVKLGYVIDGRSKFVSAKRIREKDAFYNDNISKFQYGLTFNFGYNTFNLHVYYSLNHFLENKQQIQGRLLEMKVLRIGLMFYIL